MVRKKIIGLFFLMVTFFPARLTYSKTDFPLSIKINPIRKVLKKLPIFSHKVSASVYFPDAAQTDAEPLITADGSRINHRKVKQHRWIAVSRNLLKRWGGPIQYGDTVQVNGISEELDGTYIVRDTMNKRLKNTIDILVDRHDNIMGHWKNVKITKYETVSVSM
jgi:3D (Asp-Asp-Asp) domain-containing protein